MSHPVVIGGNASLGRMAAAQANGQVLHHAPPPGSPEAMAAMDVTAMTRRMLSFELSGGAHRAGRRARAIAAGRPLAAAGVRRSCSLHPTVCAVKPRPGARVAFCVALRGATRAAGAVRRAQRLRRPRALTLPAPLPLSRLPAAAAGLAGTPAAAAPPGSPAPPPGIRDPFVIGVCGGTASGKSTVCDRIMHQLQERSVVLISQARAWSCHSRAGPALRPAGGR